MKARDKREKELHKWNIQKLQREVVVLNAKEAYISIEDADWHIVVDLLDSSCLSHYASFTVSYTHVVATMGRHFASVLAGGTEVNRQGSSLTVEHAAAGENQVDRMCSTGSFTVY